MTKMIYALCVCVFNLLKIYTNLPLAERGPRAAAIEYTWDRMGPSGCSTFWPSVGT